jgi:hypothetical protein
MREGDQPVSAFSPTQTVPPASGVKPVIASMTVDFPAPFGPIKPRISPDPTDRSTASAATIPPYRTVIELARSTT